MRHPIANPDDKRSNFDVVIGDGITSIGLTIVDSKGTRNPKMMSRNPAKRTAMKTRTGEMKYDSYNEPWTPVAQESWEGGRGQLDFETDKTHFADSFRANTQFGYFSNGPLYKFQEGIRTVSGYMPGSVKFVAVKPGTNLHMASRKSLQDDFDAGWLYLLIKRKGTPEALTVNIRANTSGLPGAVLETFDVTTDDITDVVSVEYRGALSPYTCVSGTLVWIEVTTSDADEDNHWEVGCATIESGSTAKCSDDGSDWVECPYELYYRLTPVDSNDVMVKFFKYRYSEYAIQTKNGGTPQVFLNGDRGMAGDNSGDKSKIECPGKAFTTDQYVGCVVKIVAGPGITEWQNWRTVIANDSDSLTVDEEWIETHTTATEYAILGSDDWIELTGHGLTQPVYFDPLIVNNIVYIPQGDATAIRRLCWYGGTYAWSADSTNYATCLQQVRDATNGLEVWRGQNADANGDISASKAPVVNYGTGSTYLSFGAEIPFKDERGRITGIEEFGDTTKVPWVLREGSVYQIVNNKPDEIPLRELATMMDTHNGRAHLVHNIYFYWGMGLGIERYYDKNLDDVGPNRGQGLPEIRKGYVSAMCGYAARFFVAIDAGKDGISSVLVYNLTGYHEIYRAPAVGQRIRALDFQTVPGTHTDRLFVHVGDDIVSLNFPSGGLDPLVDSSSEYVWESTVESSRVYVSMYDVTKFFRSFKIFADGLSDEQTVEMDYRLNEDTEWTTIDGAFDADVRELFPLENYGVNGISITYRLRILTEDCTKSIRGKSIVMNNISRVPVKHNYGMPYRALDYEFDIHGDPDGMTCEEKQELIDYWATSLTPLLMNCQRAIYDNKIVFIDPPALNPLSDGREHYLGKLALIEI